MAQKLSNRNAAETRASDRRSAMETSFLAGIINRVSSSFEPGSNIDPKARADFRACLGALGVHRMNNIYTEFQKHMFKKGGLLAPFIGSGEDMQPQGRAIVEEMTFFMGALHTAVVSYRENFDRDMLLEGVERSSEQAVQPLLNTMLDLYALVPYMPREIGESLRCEMGNVVTELSEMHQDLIVTAVNNCIRSTTTGTESEQKGAYFILSIVRYLCLNCAGILELTNLISSVVQPPGGSWKKGVLLEICEPLRICMLNWIDLWPDDLASIFATENDSRFDVFYQLTEKLESWASGNRKRNAIVPTMCILIAFSPTLLKNIVLELRDSNNKKPSTLCRFMAEIFRNLTPSRLMSGSNAQLQVEVSVKSMIVFYKVVAVLIRTTLKQEGADGFTSYLRELIHPHDARLRELLLSFAHPFATRECDGDRAAVCGMELTEDFVWAMYYVNSASFFSTCSPMLVQDNAPQLFKQYLLKALNRILQHESEENQARSPVWRFGAASEMKRHVFELLAGFGRILRPNGGARNTITDMLGSGWTALDVDVTNQPSTASKGKSKLDLQIKRSSSSAQITRTAAHLQANIVIDVSTSETMANLLNLLDCNPWFTFVRELSDPQCLKPIFTSVFCEYIARIIGDLISCLGREELEIGTHAESCILQFHSAKLIQLWYPKDVYMGYYSISSFLMKLLAEELSASISKSKTTRVLRTIKGCLEGGNSFLGQSDVFGDVTSINADMIRVRKAAVSTLEASLLLCICSGDLDVCSLAAGCLGLLCNQQDKLSEEIRGSNSSFPTNIYREISDTCVGSLSPKLQQKSIRSLLLKVKVPTDGIRAAIAEAYQLWVQVKAEIRRKTTDFQWDQGMDEWVSHSALLCSLGSALMTVSESSIQTSTTTESGAASEKSNDEDSIIISDMFDVMVMKSLDKRISQTMLVSLGQYTSPASIGPLFFEIFRRIETISSASERQEASGVETAALRSTISLLNQLLSILQMVFERESDVRSFSGLVERNSEGRDIMQKVMRSLALLSNRVSNDIDVSEQKDTQEYMEQFRIKSRCADVLCGFLSHRQYVVVDDNFRSSILPLLMEWTFSSVNRHSGSSSSGTTSRRWLPITSSPRMDDNEEKTIPKQLFEVLRSVEVSSIQAIRDALDSFELTPSAGRSDSFTTSGKSQATESDAEQLTVRSRTFYKYFHVLSSVLSACDLGPNRLVLESATISALINLLHANASVGFSHISRAGTIAEKDSVRYAYLRVFTETLRRRMEFAEKVHVKARTYFDLLSDLSDLVVSPNMSLVQLLCHLAVGREVEALSPRLVVICGMDSNRTMMRLLQWVVEKEMQETVKIGTLFRSESVGVKLMQCYCSSVGKGYLRAVLGPLIRSYVSQGTSLEIDPLKAGEDEKISDNMVNLKRWSLSFLDGIVSSLAQCPYPFMALCRTLAEESSRRFAGTPGCARVAVGGYVFLRFFTPGIAMPAKYNILRNNEIPPANIRRGLLLIAKVLQNLSNGTHFWEDAMLPLNPWLDDHDHLIVKFCDDICTIPPQQEEKMLTQKIDLTYFSDPDSKEENTAEPVATEEKSQEMLRSSLIYVHSFLLRVKEGVDSALKTQKDQAIQQELDVNTGEDAPSPLPNVGESKADAVGQNAVNDSGLSLLQQRPLYESLPALIASLGAVPSESGLHRILSSRVQEEEKKSGQQQEQSYMTAVKALEKYLTSVSDDRLNKITEKVRQRNIFYEVKSEGQPSPRPRFVFVLRRVSDSIPLLALSTIVLQALLPLFQRRTQFDLIVDGLLGDLVTHGQYLINWMNSLQFFIDGIIKDVIGKIYIVCPSHGLVEIGKEIMKNFNLKQRLMSERVVFISRPSDLVQHVPNAMSVLPTNTVMVETSSEHKWSVFCGGRPMTVFVSTRHFVTEVADSFLKHDLKLSTCIPLLSIADVAYDDSKRGIMSSEPFLKIGYSENPDQENKVIELTGQSLKTIGSALTAAITLAKQQSALEEVSKVAGIESVSQQQIPGILLHLAFLNMFSINEPTRNAAYLLLAQLRDAFHLKITMSTFVSDNVIVPPYPFQFVQLVSQELAGHSAQYTQEIITESVNALLSDDISARTRFCILSYLRPWIYNISMFYKVAEYKSRTSGTSSTDEANTELAGVATSFVLGMDRSFEEIKAWLKDIINKMSLVLGKNEGLYCEILELFWNVFGDDPRLAEFATEQFMPLLEDLDINREQRRVESISSSAISSPSATGSGLTPNTGSQAAGFALAAVARNLQKTKSPTVRGDFDEEEKEKSAQATVENSFLLEFPPESPADIMSHTESNTIRRASGSRERASSAGQGASGSSSSSSAVRTALEAKTTIPFATKVFIDILSILAAKHGNVVTRVLVDRMMKLLFTIGKARPFKASIVGGTVVKLQAMQLVGYSTSSAAESKEKKSASQLPVSTPTSTKVKDPDDENWTRVVAVFRPLLVLSFNNPLLLHHSLPELLYFVSVFCIMGPNILRPGLYSLMCQISHSLSAASHSLASSSEPMDSLWLEGPNSSRADLALVGALPETSRLHYIRQTNRSGSFPFSIPGYDEADSQKLKSAMSMIQDDEMNFIFYEVPSNLMNIKYVETIVGSLHVTLSASGSATAHNWHRKWWDLTLAMALKSAPSDFSARAFLTLGMIAKAEYVTNGVVSAILSTLTIAIKASANPGQDFFIESVTRSLSRMVAFCSSDVCQSLFWVSMGLILMSSKSLFLEGTRLLARIVDRIETYYFAAMSALESASADENAKVVDLETFLLSLRNDDAFAESQIATLESPSMSGVNFRCHFSFAITTVLLRGMFVPTARDAVVKLFEKLIRLTRFTRQLAATSKASEANASSPPIASTTTSQHNLWSAPQINARSSTRIRESVYKGSHPVNNARSVGGSLHLGMSGILGYAAALIAATRDTGFLTEPVDATSEESKQSMSIDLQMQALTSSETRASKRLNKFATVDASLSATTPTAKALSRRRSTDEAAISRGLSFSSRQSSMMNVGSVGPPPSEDSSMADDKSSIELLQQFFAAHNFPDQKTAILFIMTVLVFVKTCESTDEKRCGFSVLAQTIKNLPDPFFQVHDVVFAELMRSFEETSNSQVRGEIFGVVQQSFIKDPRVTALRPLDLFPNRHRQLLTSTEESMMIAKLIRSNPAVPSTSTADTQGMTYLHSIGFSELFRSGSFDKHPLSALDNRKLFSNTLCRLLVHFAEKFDDSRTQQGDVTISPIVEASTSVASVAEKKEVKPVAVAAAVVHQVAATQPVQKRPSGGHAVEQLPPPPVDESDVPPPPPSDSAFI